MAHHGMMANRVRSDNMWTVIHGNSRGGANYDINFDDEEQRREAPVERKKPESFIVSSNDKNDHLWSVLQPIRHDVSTRKQRVVRRGRSAGPRSAPGSPRSMSPQYSDYMNSERGRRDSAATLGGGPATFRQYESWARRDDDEPRVNNAGGNYVVGSNGSDRRGNHDKSDHMWSILDMKPTNRRASQKKHHRR